MDPTLSPNVSLTRSIPSSSLRTWLRPYGYVIGLGHSLSLNEPIWQFAGIITVSMKLQFEWTDGQQSADAHRVGDSARIELNGQVYELTLIAQDGPLYSFRYQDAQGQSRLIRVARHAKGNDRHGWVNGQHYAYRRSVTGRAGSRSESGESSLSPTIPSIVSQVLVDVGQAVAAGDKLILLESMKMVIPIQAPYDGTVAMINCSAGDAVEPGTPLLQLTPKEAD